MLLTSSGLWSHERWWSTWVARQKSISHFLCLCCEERFSRRTCLSSILHMALLSVGRISLTMWEKHELNCLRIAVDSVIVMGFNGLGKYLEVSDNCGVALGRDWRDLGLKQHVSSLLVTGLIYYFEFSVILYMLHTRYILHKCSKVFLWGYCLRDKLLYPRGYKLLHILSESVHICTNFAIYNWLSTHLKLSFFLLLVLLWKWTPGA